MSAANVALDNHRVHGLNGDRLRNDGGPEHCGCLRKHGDTSETLLIAVGCPDDVADEAGEPGQFTHGDPVSRRTSR
jgi:hypothetical protein